MPFVFCSGLSLWCDVLLKMTMGSFVVGIFASLIFVVLLFQDVIEKD